MKKIHEFASLSMKSEAIYNLKRSIDNWNMSYRESDKIEFVFNKRLLNISGNEKLLLVIDHPGKSDYKNQEYLSGRAGKIARSLLVNYGIIEDFYRETIVLCKTAVYGDTIDRIKMVMKRHENRWEESMALMANTLTGLMNENPELEAWILIASGTDNQIFQYYYRFLQWKLTEFSGIESRIRYFKSFANNHFELELLRSYFDMTDGKTRVSEILAKLDRK